MRLNAIKVTNQVKTSVQMQDQQVLWEKLHILIRKLKARYCLALGGSSEKAEPKITLPKVKSAGPPPRYYGAATLDRVVSTEDIC
jgi:hypothetical protein